jgi:hypothetical protein
MRAAYVDGASALITRQARSLSRVVSASDRLGDLSFRQARPSPPWSARDPADQSRRPSWYVQTKPCGEGTDQRRAAPCRSMRIFCL